MKPKKVLEYAVFVGGLAVVVAASRWAGARPTR